MKLSMPDDSTQPRGSMGYTTYATMSEGFGPGFDAPLIVAAALPSPAAASADAARIVSALRAVPGVAEVTPPVISSDRQAAMIIAYPTTQQQAPETNALVNDPELGDASAGDRRDRYAGLPDRAERG
jgi:RND superfamily putative drug exporter